MGKRKTRSASGNPAIFISHLSTERELASALKSLIERHFVQIDVFVSSIPEDLPPGKNWLDSVLENLSTCKVMLILCSSVSITRPWINFEAGAGWVRKIDVIPICHSGISPGELPLPFSLLQGIHANDMKSLRSLIARLAQIVDSRTPEVSLEEFTEFVREFESGYAGGSDLIQIYESSRDVQLDIGLRLRKAKKEVWMSGAHFSITLSDWRKEILDAVNRGIKFKIAVLDPECSALQVTADSYSMKLNELQNECRGSIESINAIREELGKLGSKNTAETFQGVVFCSLPRARYYLFDPDEVTGVVIFTPYVEGLRPSHSPAYLFKASAAVAKTYADTCRMLFHSGNRL